MKKVVCLTITVLLILTSCFINNFVVYAYDYNYYDDYDYYDDYYDYFLDGTTKPSIELYNLYIGVVKGKTYKLKPDVSPKGTKVKYVSKDKKIATVSPKGIVKGKKTGTTKITAKIVVNGKTYKSSCKVKVVKNKSELKPKVTAKILNLNHESDWVTVNIVNKSALPMEMSFNSIFNVYPFKNSDRHASCSVLHSDVTDKDNDIIIKPGKECGIILQSNYYVTMTKESQVVTSFIMGGKYYFMTIYGDGRKPYIRT